MKAIHLWPSVFSASWSKSFTNRWLHLCHQPCSTHTDFSHPVNPPVSKRNPWLFSESVSRSTSLVNNMSFISRANLWCQWKCHLKTFLTHHIFQQLLPLLLWNPWNHGLKVLFGLIRAQIRGGQQILFQLGDLILRSNQGFPTRC